RMTADDITTRPLHTAAQRALVMAGSPAGGAVGIHLLTGRQGHPAGSRQRRHDPQAPRCGCRPGRQRGARAEMSAPGAPRPRRRSLAALLTASGGAVLLGGCGGPSPVPTSAAVARDPLVALDAAHWDARSAEELRALPLQGAAEELETWADLGAEDSAVDTAREQLTGFLGTAYLDPSALRGLSDQDALDHISSATPEFWR